MKKKIAFVTGGYSSEAVVSYKSAVSIEANIDPEKYDYWRIDITPEEWFHPTAAGGKVQVDKSDFTLTIDGKRIRFDAVLIGIHGTPGEDGKLQGYFDLLNLPYTSCDAATSAITFNKRYTVAIAAFSGIAVAKSMHLFRQQKPLAGDVLSQLSLPAFVKPNNGGSSIGMSKVSRAEEMGAALEKAFTEDDQVLVEEMITGPEFTVGVFRSAGEIQVLPVTQLKISKDFFDFEAKYTPGMTEEITPAAIPEPVAEKIRHTARKIYQVLNCSGVVRIDIIYNEELGVPYMLEVNTVPGQTATSIIPQQVHAMGWTLNQFYSSLIEDALARAAKA